MNDVALTGASSTVLADGRSPARDIVDGAPVCMTDTLALSALPPSVKAARSVAGSNGGSAVRAVVKADTRGAPLAEGRTTRKFGEGAARHHSLMDLVREREPSIEQLLSERYPDSPEFFTPFGHWVMERIAEDVTAHRVRAGIERQR